ncbi:MAG: deoxyribodipyrimidine photo-lyase [Thiotrichaceae bacterium]|nr:deoxyribodipyrimidine photo-lyase [Thiotrichaceae bacterium]
MATALLWLRRDLRLADNPALVAAIQQGYEIIPVYIHAPNEAGAWQIGAASRCWLHHSLVALQQQLLTRRSQLFCFRSENSLHSLQQLIQETQASAVFWNRLYEPALIARDTEIKQQLRSQGIHTQSYNSALLNEPWQVQNKSKQAYKVFTPYWKTCLNLPIAAPLPAPEQIPLPKVLPQHALAMAELNLLPRVNWDRGFYQAWDIGEVAAQCQLHAFGSRVVEYATQRDFPAIMGVSRLSPYLHFGELSPQQVLTTVQNFAPALDILSFQRQLYWREFAYHLLYHFPETPQQALNLKFERFPWQENPQVLRAWQQGETGIPIIDAGMRELWHTGWMHNRVRMLVASWLTKNALIHWQTGARWFWETLLDADLANNTLGWQWVAGCGADAAPYYRLFNPMLQSSKFDEAGAYIRRWIPELNNLDKHSIHAPWTAANPPRNYPAPVLDFQQSRERALAAYQQLKGI